MLAKGGISPHDIRVHTTSSGVMANNVSGTGGSVTSEIAAAAVQVGLLIPLRREMRLSFEEMLIICLSGLVEVDVPDV